MPYMACGLEVINLTILPQVFCGTCGNQGIGSTMHPATHDPSQGGLLGVPSLLLISSYDCVAASG